MKQNQSTASLTAILQNALTTEQQVLFLPTGNHPEWEDQQTVFQLAISQILEPVIALPDELPLAYIGMHSRTRFTGKRDSVGFLITDHRTLVQTDVSVMGTPEKAKAFCFTTTQKAGVVTDLLWEMFTQKLEVDFPQEQLTAMQAILFRVLQAILPILQQSGHLPHEIKTATILAERIQELGLQSVFKFPGNNEKLFAKAAARFGATGIRCGMVDKPLIGGVYGLVITTDGISSRDLMEEPVHTSWQLVLQTPAMAASEPDTIMIGKQKHIVPKHHTSSRNALILLINELAQGKIS